MVHPWDATVMVVLEAVNIVSIPYWDGSPDPEDLIELTEKLAKKYQFHIGMVHCVA